MNKLKRTFFEAALCEGTVKVTLLSTPALAVPMAVRFDGTVLEYGHSMAKPIPDLEISDAGISATLSFANKSHKTFVPWEAIVRMQQFGGFIVLWPIEVEQFTHRPRAVA